MGPVHYRQLVERSSNWLATRVSPLTLFAKNTRFEWTCKSVECVANVNANVKHVVNLLHHHFFSYISHQNR